MPEQRLDTYGNPVHEDDSVFMDRENTLGAVKGLIREAQRLLSVPGMAQNEVLAAIHLQLSIEFLKDS